MRRHVDLLGILYVLSGGLWVLLGVALLALAFGAIAVLAGARQEGQGLAAGLGAAVFVVVAAATIAWGAANVWAGWGLRQCRPWSRLAGLSLAVLNLFVLPFGTALGAYGLWVLLKDDARQLFQAPR